MNTKSLVTVNGHAVVRQLHLRRKTEDSHRTSTITELSLLEYSDGRYEFICTEYIQTSKSFATLDYKVTTYRSVVDELASGRGLELLNKALTEEDENLAWFLYDLATEVYLVSTSEEPHVIARRAQYTRWALENMSLRPDYSNNRERWIAEHSFAW